MEGSSKKPYQVTISSNPLVCLLTVCAKMVSIYEEIKRIASLDKLNPLIIGETGVGKTIIFEWLVQNSGRSNKKKNMISCVELQTELGRNELFGHLKGSYTGAYRSEVGFLAEYNKGTLLLDDIQDLPIEMQPSLFRYLDTMMVRKIGEVEYRHCDVRLVFATNADIYDKTIFKEDFFYRIIDYPIFIPALRERREDIPLLCNYFHNKLQSNSSISQPIITKKALTKLIDYDWPGNVRQLEKTIGYLYSKAIAYGTDINCDLFNEWYDLIGVHVDQSDTKYITSSPLNESERVVIDSRLKQFNGNRSATAKSLGISRSTLLRKLNKYELI